MQLMALDLPEFDRPTTASSAPLSAGKPLGSAALVRNLAGMLRSWKARWPGFPR
jgi:hypothetical protein